MQFTLTKEQVLIQQMAIDYLSDKQPFALMQTLEYPSEQLEGITLSTYCHNNWADACHHMGWQAGLMDEQFGGLGLGWVEYALIFGQIGHQLWVSPSFSTVALSQPLLRYARAAEANNSVLNSCLASIINGERTIALALPLFFDNPTTALIDHLPFRYTHNNGETALHGIAQYIIDGHTSDWLLIPAKCTDNEKIKLFLIDTQLYTSAYLQRKIQPSLDPTFLFGCIEVSNIILQSENELVLECPHDIICAVIELASVCHSAQMLGGMSALLAMTVEYLQNRQQFGRPIGQFQSLKHKAADMMLQVESAKTAVYAAACQADAFWQSNDDSLSHLKRAASIAQAYVSDAYCSLAGNAIQMHGAPGTTWEYAVHWYFKRAKCSEMLLGDAAFHRERLVMLYEEESE